MPESFGELRITSGRLHVECPPTGDVPVPVPPGDWTVIVTRGSTEPPRAPLDASRLSGVFLADSLWGLAALLWVTTGLWRAFGGLEKGSAFYLGSTAFWIKMTLLGLILVLEVWPMVTLIRWRLARARGA